MSETPAGWRSSTLGEIGQYFNGRGFRKSEWRDTGRPIIRIQNLTGSSAGFNYFQGEVEERHVAHPGDLLVSWAATLGAFIWTGPQAVVNQHIFKVESNINLKFHKYLLDYKLEELMRHTHGSGMVHITKGSFDALPVVLPPQLEQRRIVDLLEDHLSRLDAAQRSATLAQRRLEALTAALRDAAVSGGIGRVRRNDPLPSGWRWAPVGEMADSSRGALTIGPFGSNLKVADYREAGVPLVFVRNVRSAKFDGPGLRYVRPDKALELSSHRVEPGDVVVTKMGDPPGDAAVYDATIPGVITADVIRIRPAPGVDAHYLALALNSSLVRQQIAEITRGVAQQKVSLDRYRSEILVPTPVRATQRRVAEVFTAQSGLLVRLSDEIRVAQAKSAGLRRSLLAAAFSGRLTEPVDTLEFVDV